jgi:CRP-like cAMP-binding protein
MLAAVPAFKGFDQADLEALVPHLKSQAHAAGALLIREGELGDVMYLVHSGSVKVSKREGGNAEVVLDQMGPGAFFGEFSLIDKLPRSADVSAETPSVVLELHRGEFEGFLASDARRAAIFYRNCLTETFLRFRNLASKLTFSSGVLSERTGELKELRSGMAQARKLQQFFIPSDLAGRFTGAAAETLFRPCDDVGGDLIDAVRRSDGTTAALIADVCGHGVVGAIATGVLKSAFATWASTPGIEPGDLATRLNVHCISLLDDLFATAWFIHWNPATRALSLSKAGHPPPIIWKARTKSFFEWEQGGVCIGFSDQSRFTQTTLVMEPGDLALFYTDGITEEENGAHEAFGEDRLKIFVRTRLLANPAAPLCELSAELERFSGKQRFEDDVTAMVMRF